MPSPSLARSVRRLVRLRSRRTPPAPAALTLFAAGLLAVTGWLGGELTFRKRIGVVPAADLT